MKFYKGMKPWNKGKKGILKRTGKWWLTKHCSICDKLISEHAEMCKSCSHKKDNGFIPRKWSEEQKIEMSKICKGRPSAFKGHHHTDRMKEKMSEERIGIKHPDFCGDNNPSKRPEVRAKMHKPHPSISGKNHPHFGKTMKPKFIQYKNRWFRSNWEVIYAKELDSKGIKWLYESRSFNLGDTTYTPDFYLSETKEYIEVKGYYSDVFIKKFELFKQKYPNIKIKILDETYFNGKEL